MWHLSARTITSRTRSPSRILCSAALGFLTAFVTIPNPSAWAADKRDFTAQQSPIQTSPPISEQNTFNPGDLKGKRTTPLVSPNDDLKTRIGKLTKLLSHPDPSFRYNAAVELGQIGPLAKEANPALNRALKDPDEKVRVAAKNALEKIQKTLPKVDAEKAKKARIATEKARKAKIAAEDKARNAQIAAEKARKAKIAAEKAKKVRDAKEEARKARIAEEEARKAKIAAEEAEKARIAAEKAKQAQIDAEKAEKAWIVAEEVRQAQGNENILYGSLALVSLILLSYYLKNRKADKTKGPADILVRDWAIDSLDDDRLGTGDLARSIGRFLRNENTKAPLTLAITGNWGSGKSSIMGMLKDYLDRAGYPTIWFNAWHHHEETHLFGALLERLRQGLPAPWTPSGIWFRLRLFWTRMKKQKVSLALIGGLLVFTVAFLWEDGSLHGKYFYELIIDPSWQNAVPSAIHLTAFLAALTKILDAVTSFGIKPQKLFRKVSKAFNTVSFASDPGLRFKLEEDLGDISDALGNKPLTIFIDDMDRCPPERALKVLESVNFLSSSPRRCFIVMGIWLKQTVTSISREFTDFIEEKNPQGSNESDGDYRSRLHTLRVEHAMTYLDKMIQIEIAVPPIEPEVLANLARSELDKGKNEPPKKSFAERWKEYRQADDTLKREIYDRPIRFLNKKAIPMIFLLVVLSGGYFLAVYSKIMIAGLKQQVTLVKIEEIDQEIKTEKNEPRIAQEANANLKKLQQSRAKLVNVEEQSIKELAQAKTNTGTAWTGVGLSAGLFGLVFGLVMSRKINLQDSENYRKALDIWAPVLALKEPNPRRLKRLVNLLRLISMRDKDQEKNRKTGNAAENPSSKDEMQEDDMPKLEKRAIKFIMLMALEELEVNPMEFIILSKEAKFQKGVHERDLTQFVQSLKIANRDKEGWLERKIDAREELAKALVKFIAEFPNVWPIEEDVERYREYLKGVVLREV